MTRDERLHIGAAVPGGLLTIAAAVTAVGAGAVIGMPAGWVAVIGAAVLAGGVARMVAGPWIAAGILMIGLVAADPAPWRTATVIAAVHLLQVLGSLMLVVPVRSRIALRALAPTAVRFALVQLICQAVGLLASLLPTRSGLPIAVIAGSAAALLFAAVCVRMLGARRDTAFPNAERAHGPGVGGPS